MLVVFLVYDGSYNPPAFLVKFFRKIDLNYVRRIEYEAPGRLDYLLSELAEERSFGSIQAIGRQSDFLGYKYNYYLMK